MAGELIVVCVLFYLCGMGAWVGYWRKEIDTVDFSGLYVFMACLIWPLAALSVVSWRAGRWIRGEGF